MGLCEGSRVDALLHNTLKAVYKTSFPTGWVSALYHFEASCDDDGVEERLRDVRVEVRHGAGEGGDVVRQAVVRVLQPAVQVGHPVEGLQWGFWNK